jgi:hypothetical protein
MVELVIEPAGPPVRRGEPVRCGIPWPAGQVADVDRLVLTDAEGRPVPLQARALDHWPDRSVRWALLDWKVDLDGPARYFVGVARADQPLARAATPLVSRDGDGELTIDTGAALFRLGIGRRFPLDSVTVTGRPASRPSRLAFEVEDATGRRHEPWIDRLTIEESGPVRTTVGFEGRLVSAPGRSLAEISGRLHFFSGSATAQFVLSITNPRRARHPENCWDLGDEGSIHLKDASLKVVLGAVEGTISVACSPERGVGFDRFGGRFTLEQDSSGGENWRSTIHVNRHGVVPNTFRGYRIRTEGPGRDGLRATPIVAVEHGGGRLALTMKHFWENFPKAIEVADGAIVLRLFPSQYADTHEIQGGERKTHEFAIAFDKDDVTEEPLAWCRDPLLPKAQPTWYSASGAIPYLTPRSDDPNPLYLELVDAAIEGPDTFERKREVIDEYGWRHFGDIYGDHEAVYHTGRTPLVSHYNNQYDALAGLAYQFLRSGDARWWALMDELARHVADIDIYHTTRDKSAYSGGLFWHTCHYVDAGTSTHRTYPRAAGGGGGPSGGQLYSSGFLLHHFLTGDPLSREEVVGLGHYVINADDGNKTFLRWLSTGPTGHITGSGDSTYHGPGRAAANSITTLINAHIATGSAEFLDKAEQLIRRCIHPADRIEDRNLLDAERRWFYTMFLQALGRYLDHKAEIGPRDAMYAYTRASLLHYARWMADHEYPYLEHPEKLEYPTETWAAQDMRKSDVFKYAAQHAEGEERIRFLERSDFFFRASTTTLGALPTRTLARPVVLLLTNGFMHAYFQRNPDVKAPRPDVDPTDFGRPEAFVPQKAQAKRRLVMLATTAALTGIAGLIALVL